MAKKHRRYCVFHLSMLQVINPKPKRELSYHENMMRLLYGSPYGPGKRPRGRPPRTIS
jgi:hypothetical protein